MENREIKAFVAVSTLVIAILIGLNELIAPDGLTEYASLIGGGLLVLSAAFWAWMWRSGRAAEASDDSEASSALQLPQATVKEWSVKKADE